MMSLIIKQGAIINNDEVKDIFKCSGQGGMRRSKKTNSLILVSNNVKSLYTNRWDGEILNYTGMGATGDQELLGTQNKTLLESNDNGVCVYLFEVYKPQQYTYRGEVELVSAPFQEIQKDSNNEDRNVWIFPIRLKNKEWDPELSVLKELEQLREKAIKKLSLEELIDRAKQSHEKPSKRSTSESVVYERDPAVKEYSLRAANGTCQLCNQPAPFNNKAGHPFLESHHIEWLSHGGRDTIENIIALCPNCHRKMHIVEADRDVEYLKYRSIELLERIIIEASPLNNVW